MTKTMVEIAKMRARGFGIRAIARALDLAPSTVHDTLRKGTDWANKAKNEALLAEEYLHWMEQRGSMGRQVDTLAREVRRTQEGKAR